MDTAWIQVFVLTLSECVAPTGKTVCQPQETQYVFYDRRDCEAVLQALGTSHRGLSAEEAERRLADAQRRLRAAEQRLGERLHAHEFAHGVQLVPELHEGFVGGRSRLEVVHLLPGARQGLAGKGGCEREQRSSGHEKSTGHGSRWVQGVQGRDQVDCTAMMGRRGRLGYPAPSRPSAEGTLRSPLDMPPT